jgi:ADP-ribose pyrophosphatase YjhB (NUDIX family)
MSDIWRPHVTVASLVERDGKFLLVEERAENSLVLNQPAGHWEANETLAEGAAREALEETGHRIEVQALVGVYRWPHRTKPITYLRFAFAARVIDHDPARTLDEGIVRALWLTPDELRADTARHRSPLVQRCVDDYLAGRRYPLDLIAHFD